MSSGNIEFIWNIKGLEEELFMSFFYRYFPELKERFISAQKLGEHKWRVTLKDTGSQKS